ncbi:ParM/StbA family protein [Eubacterium sp. LFL-14]|uniref:ParM/StbA family protein n=1 Tax=Eubacterium album TaxID=2978477 RepID=A0ABT2LY89_9FIRM|nr:ParM/StbA family protein [Eubacterium sp. LFL-14]MCT7397833.1 ParM/StbA family protein [Eubacterium sp. LFL-14]
MVISIDLGNKNVKTDNEVIPTSLYKTPFNVGFGEPALKYNGNYYYASGQRLKYCKDKTTDESFYILNLIAVAKELDKALKEAGNTDKVITNNLTLLHGLPPAHMKMAKKYKEYFESDDYVTFEYNSRTYNIRFNHVYVYPQAYAAAVTTFDTYDFSKNPKVVVIDIGGFTADYLLLENQILNRDVCGSLNKGIILLYNKISTMANDNFDLSLDEGDIDRLLGGRLLNGNQQLLDAVQSMAQDFVDTFFEGFAEKDIELKTVNIIFVGGGALTLKPYIMKSPLIKAENVSFIDDIKANVKGYRECYEIQQSVAE